MGARGATTPSCKVVGLIGEFEGPRSRGIVSNSVDISEGATLAARRLKKENQKPCIELVTYDTKGSIANVAPVLEEAIRTGVHYFIGLGYSDHALVAEASLKKLHAVLISPTATSDELVKADSRIILPSPRNSLMARKLAAAALSKGVKKVSVIYARNNSYSSDIAMAFQEHFVKGGGTITASIPIRSGSLGVWAELDGLRNSQDTHVFLPLYAAEVTQIITHFYGNHIQKKFIASDSWAGAEAIDDLFRKIPIDGFGIRNYSPDGERKQNRAFVREYTREYGKLPSENGAFAYEGILLYRCLFAHCTDAELKNKLQSCVTKCLPYEGLNGQVTASEGLNFERTMEITDFVRQTPTHDNNERTRRDKP